MKHLLFITFIIISLNSYPQNESYIEIKVSDTIYLTVEKIIYKVTNEDNNNNVNFNFFPQEENLEDDISEFSETEFEKFLKKNNIQYKKEHKIDYNIPGNLFENYYFTLNSEKDLLKLVETLKETNGINGKIDDIEHAFSDKQKKELFNKLYLKAKTEAEYLAASCKTEIGKLLQIKEETSILGDYEDYYKEIFKQPNSPFNFFGFNIDLEKIYKRTLIFRFELK